MPSSSPVVQHTQKSSSSSSSSSSSLEPHYDQNHKKPYDEQNKPSELRDTLSQYKTSNTYQMLNRTYCELCKSKYMHLNSGLTRCNCGLKSLTQHNSNNENSSKLVKVYQNTQTNGISHSSMQTMPLKEFRRIIGLRDSSKRDTSSTYTTAQNANNNMTDFRQTSRPLLSSNHQRVLDSQKFHHTHHDYQASHFGSTQNAKHQNSMQNMSNVSQQFLNFNSSQQAYNQMSNSSNPSVNSYLNNHDQQHINQSLRKNHNQMNQINLADVNNNNYYHTNSNQPFQMYSTKPYAASILPIVNEDLK
jgi:hypothetical protein